MCYYVSQRVKLKDLVEYYQAPANVPDYVDSEYHIVGGFSHPRLKVISGDGSSRSTELMQWGLLPPTTWRFDYTKALKHSNNTLNAKSETIHEVKSFKGNISKYRCVLPVEGFFEYKHADGDKLPYFIHPKEKPFFNLACVYGNYQDPATGIWTRSFGIVTGAANELMADIHNSKFRQPIILDDEQISAWLDPKSDPVEIDMLMQPCDDSQMAAYRVPRELIKMGNVPEVLNKID